MTLIFTERVYIVHINSRCKLLSQLELEKAFQNITTVKKMLAITLLVVFALVASESKAMAGDISSCSEIRSSLQKKTKSYQTVCLDAVSLISSDCCKNIEEDIKKRCQGYKTLCPEMSKPLTKGMLFWLTGSFWMLYFLFRQKSVCFCKL